MKDQKYFENTKNTLRASKSFQICGLRNRPILRTAYWVSFWNAECVYFFNRCTICKKAIS